MFPNLASEFYLLPCFVGVVWMYISLYCDPESEPKRLVYYQFMVVIVLSMVLGAITKGKGSDWVYTNIWWLSLLSTSAQLPIAYALARKHPESNVGAVVVVLSLMATIVNAFLVIDVKTSTSFIYPVYNECIFVLNVLAIASCNGNLANGFCRVVFGGDGSARSRIRWRIAAGPIKKDEEVTQ